MKFGILTLQDMPWDTSVKLWQQMDSFGFDSIWVADHFVNYANPPSPWYDGWTALAGLANATSKARIGALVTSIPLRHPAILARQAMTIDHMSNGRLDIGIGSGAPGTMDPTYKMIGIEDWPTRERIKRLREQVEIIDLLLRNSSTSYDGEYYKLDEALMAPECIQKPRPPLTIAAHVKGSLKIAAEYADTWNSYGADFGAPVEVVVEKTRKRSELLDKYCEKAGRDPGSVGRSLLIFGAEANTAFASGEHFTEIVERYSALGITEILFYYPFFAPDQVSNIEKIAKETIPTLRKL